MKWHYKVSEFWDTVLENHKLWLLSFSCDLGLGTFFGIRMGLRACWFIFNYFWILYSFWSTKIFINIESDCYSLCCLWIESDVQHTNKELKMPIFIHSTLLGTLLECFCEKLKDFKYTNVLLRLKYSNWKLDQEGDAK